MALVRQTNSQEDIVHDPKKFIEMCQLHVPTEDWSKIADGTNLKSTYVEYFVNLISLKEISCVLKSNGYYRSKKNGFVIRLNCCQAVCPRKYLLKQKSESLDFSVMCNSVPKSDRCNIANRFVRRYERLSAFQFVSKT